MYKLNIVKKLWRNTFLRMKIIVLLGEKELTGNVAAT